MPGNLRQLVLRRDTATGLLHIGLDIDMPPGRYQHLELICELENNQLPAPGSDLFHIYEDYLQEAQRQNQQLISIQSANLIQQGLLQVPLSLSQNKTPLCSDELGNFYPAATQLLAELTHSQRSVWAALDNSIIVHIRPRQPSKTLDKLSYQVWYHQQLHQLSQISSHFMEGELQVHTSGLWFKENRLQN